MSFDISVYRPCDHRLLEQKLVLQPDLKTLPVPFPIASGTPELYYNLERMTDETAFEWQVVPRQSLFLNEDVSDTYNGLLVTVSYPPIKKGFGVQKVVLKVDGVEVTPSDIDYGRGEIALPMGLPVTESITVTYEQDQLSTVRFRNVVFKKPFRTARNLFQVNYATTKDYCLKCLGRGYVFDWNLKADGSIPIITDEKKLVQDITRYVLTTLGSDPYRDWLGTRLRGLIGKKIPSERYVAEIINREVRTTLGKLTSLQRQQAQFQGVTLNEALDQVTSVNTTLDPRDPTLWRVEVKANTLAGTEVSFVSSFSTAFGDFAVGR